MFSAKGSQSRFVALMLWALVILGALLLATPFYFLAPIPLLGLLGFIYLCRYPQLGVYALIFLIPFGAFRKISLGGAEINVAWLIAGATFIVMVCQRIIYKRSFFELRTELTPWLVAFFMVGIISTGMSPYMSASIGDLKLWVAAFLYIVLVLSLVPQSGFFKVVPDLMIFGVALSAGLGNLSYVFGLELFTEEHMGGSLNRSIGGTIDPNNLSLMIISTLPLIMQRIMFAKTPRIKLLYLAVLFNQVVGVGLTFSRGGFLVFLVTCMFIAYEYRSYLKVRYLGFALLGLTFSVSTFVVVMPDSFWERQKSLKSWDDSSLVRRSSYVEVAADAVIERPLFGHGLDSFYQIYAQTQYAKLDKETGKILGRYAHNSYIEIIVGTGVIGLIIFLTIMRKALACFQRARLRYIAANMIEQSYAIGAMRLSLLSTLIYLLIFSETHHKFMLVGLAMSQLALRYTDHLKTKEETKT